MKAVAMRCEHVGQNFRRCPRTAYPGSIYCWRHLLAEVASR
jgi:hypothetical protein